MTFENCKLSNRKLISIEQIEDHKTKKSNFKTLKGLEHCSTQDNVWALKARVKCKNSSYTIFSKDRAMSIDTRYSHISIPVPHARIFSMAGQRVMSTHCTTLTARSNRRILSIRRVLMTRSRRSLLLAPPTFWSCVHSWRYGRWVWTGN